MDSLETRYHVDRTPLAGGARVQNARRNADGQKVVVKCVPGAYPAPAELAALRHEYALLRRLASAGARVALALDYVRYGQSEALILAPAPGRSLKHFLSEAEPIEPLRFCDIAIALAACLEGVHGAGIVHKDVKPAHFFVDEKSGTATLIDFGLATELTRERARPVSADRLEGTLAYLSPEQTGRMNRWVDRRSDLYCLGVTLYELCTGWRPFPGEDPLELIHAHLARTPVEPSVVRPEIPSILSAIVMRLLEKSPDARYQTAAGLRADLELARRSMAESGSWATFELGKNDHPAELRIPEALYGREEQRRALLAAFHRVCAGSTELLLLAGAAGVGKSALVQEVHRVLVRGGHFVSGKFDQFDRGVPYSALATACGEIVRVHLAASKAALEDWKQRVKQALGQNARVVADVVPELELALGPQPPVVELPPSEAQNRFERSFQHFIQASAQTGCPLVLFLDDLQWADSASLAVLRQVLSSPGQQHLLVIGNYRDEEVDARHPLTHCLEALKDRVPMHRIRIEALGAGDVEQLVSDALPFRAQPVEPLARLIMQKTSGNPFFVVQFLQRLEGEGMLVFRPGEGFSWDNDAIAALEATDNVVDLVVKRLGRLDARARELLSLAACIGHTFRMSALGDISGQEPREVIAGLRAAALDGLVAPQDANHRLLGDLLDAPDSIVDATYRFAHDRVQQAAYVTIPDAQRSQAHLRLGRRLLAAAGEAGPSDADLFEVVGHLNRGREHLAGDERLTLARLNRRAAERASAASAHEAALGFSTVCLELLGEDPWSTDYECALAAHRVAIGSHFLASNEAPALVLIRSVENNARTMLDRVPVRNLKSDLLTNQGNLEEALRVSTETLTLLGEEMPDPGDKAALGAAIGSAFGAYQQALGAREVSSLRELPVMTDPEMLARLSTMAGAIPAAFQSNPELNVLLVLRAAHLSLTHGNGPLSPFFYNLYGIVHQVITGDYARAFEFGQLGLELCARPEHAIARCRAHFIFATHISPWTRPLQDSFPHHDKGIAAGLDAGDVIHVAYCAGFNVAYRLYAGEALTDVRDRIPGYQAMLTQIGGVINLTFLTCVERLLDSLRGQSDRFGSLDGNGFSESKFEMDLVPTTAAVYGVKKAMARYIAGDAEAALLATEQFHPLPAIYYNSEFPFYHGMACAQIALNAEPERRADLLARLDKDIERFATWARFCPNNFAAQHELLVAEAYAGRGANEMALDAYERAIERALAGTALHHIALAYERAGRFHLRGGRQRLARTYLAEASNRYERWGATAKVARLREEFPETVRLALAEVAGTTARSSTVTTVGGAGALDLTSAIRATQAISSELRLEPLLRRLMEILVENAGATQGHLVMPHGGSFEVRASLCLDPESIEVDLHEPLEQSSRLPASVVQYCSRSREPVVLNDATADQRFAHDPMIAGRDKCSIACLPLLHQGTLAGVLYLENGVGTGVFHKGRVERLTFLAGHAAVALRNAVLYDQLQEANETLEQRVAERTAELSGRNADMRRVLDNVSQGLLTVDLEGRLASERSSVVDQWFGAFEAGTRAWDYFSGLDAKFAAMLRLNVEMLREACLPEECVLDQLPSAMSHAGRHYRFGYQPVRGSESLAGLLIVVDDVTPALMRAREEADQREQLALFKALSRDRVNLLCFFDEGRALIDEIGREGAPPAEIRAPLHTLKGTAAMLDFEVLAGVCHNAESALEEGRFGPEIVQGLSRRWSSLESGLHLLLGRDARDRVEVPRLELAALASRLKAGASAEEAIESIERLQLEPLARPLGYLGERARDLCRRLQRGEPVVRIDDHGLWGDTLKGSRLWSALVHLARNAVDHGMDTPEERRAAGKSPVATLEFSARRDGENVLIEVADDGRGIDWQLVQERARQRGLPSTARADLVQALFAPSFSTRDEVTVTSGRGVGLDAVRRELSSLDGTIEVDSEPGRGCRFIVRVAAAALGVRTASPARPSNRASRPPGPGQSQHPPMRGF
jgi:predicted ATPase/GAF domain-containing protein/HPt (histidine-containing phosphotransfer) domain-containing protein